MNTYEYLSGGDRTPQQDPQSPNNDPGQNNPHLPEGPSDKPRPQSDPGKQPIDVA